MDIVLYVSKTSHGKVCSEVLSKVVPCQHEICEWFQNKISYRFSEHRRSFLEVLCRISCSLINAVMKYLNFCSSSSKLESVTCRFTKNLLKFFKEFLHKCRTAILKKAFWWLLLRITLFQTYSWMAASQGQL